jgi:hypothetical protein
MLEKDIVSKWIADNTFECSIGKVSRSQCMALRERPQLNSSYKYNEKLFFVLPRPIVCEQCAGPPVVKTMPAEQKSYQISKRIVRKSAVKKTERSVGKARKVGGIPSTTEIVCSICQVKKPGSAFYRSSKDGYFRSACRVCEGKLRVQRSRKAKIPPACLAELQKLAAAHQLDSISNLIGMFGVRPVLIFLDHMDLFCNQLQK